MQTSSEIRIKDILARNLHRYYPELDGSRIKRITVRALNSRGIIGRVLGGIVVEPGRFECRVELHGGGEKEFFVKKHRLSAVEYHRLRELWTYFGDCSEYAIPRALDYVAEENMIISEKSKGKNFAVYLMASIPVVRLTMCVQAKQREIEERVKQAARWLGFFQRKTFLGKSELLESHSMRICRLLKGMTCLSHNEKNQILDILIDAASLRVPQTACHGLYAPRNILLIRNGIMVTDWKFGGSLSRAQFTKDYVESNELLYDHCLYDFHCFIQHGLRGLRRFDFMPHAYLARLESIFMSEYSMASQFNISREAMEITRLLFLIDYLQERLIFEMLPRKGGYLYRTMHEITKTKWINQTLQDIRDSIARVRSVSF